MLVYFSGILKEHIKCVKKLLGKIKEYKLYLQPEKYKFHKKETEFSSFITFTEGVKTDLKKV